VIDCAERTHCTGDACFCGSGLCAAQQGPCASEIAAAAGTLDPLLIGAMGRDPTTALGHATAVDMCRVTQCKDVCVGPGAI
jgi:hypothetical protein